jgi:hypothetical protein
VRYDSGQIVYSQSFLASGGFGIPWGHSLSYGNVPVGNAISGPNGYGWYVAELPNLDFTSEGLAIINSATNNDWFAQQPDNSWSNMFDGFAQISLDTESGLYVLLREDGTKSSFYSSGPLAGKLASMMDPDGWVTMLEWNESTGELVRVRWVWENKTRDFSYDHVPAGGNSGLLSAVTMRLDGRNVRRVTFTYHEGGSGGEVGNLATATVEHYLEETGTWTRVSRFGFRYYLTGEANGFTHGLKAIFNPEAMQRLEAAGIDLRTANDASVLPYSDHWFEYDMHRRVKVERVRGGEAVFGLAYYRNPAAPGPDDVMVWDTYTVETLPDGSVNRVYSNNAGQPLARIHEEPDTEREWVKAWFYDSTFRLVQQAEPSAVESVTEPVGGVGTLTVNLRSDAGLIREWTFYASTDPGTGSAQGFKESELVREGTSGTAALLAKWTYDTVTALGQTIHPVRENLTFPVAGMPEVDAPRTTYARTYRPDGSGGTTLQVLQLTTTPPVVSTEQHGTGSEEPTRQVMNDEGRIEWEQDARGFINYYAYNTANGARTQTIQDVDTALMANVPAGWVTPTGGGRHLITDYMNDATGGTLRVLGPWFSIDPATVGADGETPLRVRTVDYTLYRETRHEVWSARGYVTGEDDSFSWHIIGPVSIRREDAEGNVTDEIQATPSCSCGPLGPNTFTNDGGLPPRSSWTRWLQHVLDAWGRVIEDRRYYRIPESGEGAENQDYNATRFGYDVMNIQNRSVSPGGTITRTVYDSRGLKLAVWIGLNDTGATSSDPSGGGAAGNDMRLVWQGQYDDGNAGEDGNLTLVTQPVNDDSALDRITSMEYDFRDRRVSTTQNDGVRDYITTQEYDNLDHVIEMARYHTAVASANRTQFDSSSYDSRGRVFEQKKYYVNTDGTLGSALVAGRWYDADGNTIKQTSQGAKAVTKTVFDSLNLATTSYLVAEAESTSSENTNSVALDVVITQGELLYDDSKQVIAQTQRERFDDATGTGPLHGPNGDEPRSRDSHIALYSDPVGRQRFMADFGTAGGAVWLRPALHPDPSDVVLVSEQRYAADGGTGEMIDPKGIVRLEIRDAAGRRVKLLEGKMQNSQ